jgi:glycosyltransferase involved in cell wall biosynthesis
MRLKPTVSIIIPCYNEQDTIAGLLEALYAQTYPRAALEVIIADGMSEDNTRREIDRFQSAHADLPIRVVDNPRRAIPAALNQALAAAQNEIIVRLDAHSIPRPDYVACSVANLEAGRGDMVGGVWEIRPRTPGWLPRAIAQAASHRLAVGDARYRYTSAAAEVDTVPFGAYRRSLAEKLGGYDESLLTNEDYEFNTRIRQSGGKVYLDPAIRTVYFARPNLASLARQYWRYGYWKYRMLQRYPGTVRWRQALPPLFVSSLVILAVLSVFWPPARWVLLAEAAAYIFILALAGLRAAVSEKSASLAIGLPLAIAAMHFSWGAGFLWSLIQRAARL